MFILWILLAWQPADLDIVLVQGSDAEQAIQTELTEFLENHDLSPWMFTHKIRIDEQTRIPHSHPVLTLNVRSRGGELLATFIHEQLHWWLDSKPEVMKKLNAAMAARYPDAPKGRKGGGARDHQSTLMHLTNCFLEFDGLRRLLGEAEARRILSEKGYYTWIYAKVLEDTDALETMIEAAGMIP